MKNTILLILVSIASFQCTNVNAKNLDIATKLLTCQNAMTHPANDPAAIVRFALSDLSVKLQYAITAIHGEYKQIKISDEFLSLTEEGLELCKGLINSREIFDIKAPLSGLPDDPYIRFEYCANILGFLRRSYRKGTENEVFLQNMQSRHTNARLYFDQFENLKNKKDTAFRYFHQYLDKTGGSIGEREWRYCLEMAENF